MISQTLVHLNQLAAQTNELASGLPNDAFTSKLSDRSNTIGAQFWCVVGARESYQTGIENDGWSGFSCSLTTTSDRDVVVNALDESARSLEALTNVDAWSEGQQELLLGLIEHEAQHQGQLIRFVYGLGYDFPQSWKDSWALE